MLVSDCDEEKMNDKKKQKKQKIAVRTQARRRLG
jgi:hypothetical protein